LTPIQLGPILLDAHRRASNKLQANERPVNSVAMTLTGWQALLGGTEDQEIKIFLKNGQTNKKLNCQVANL